MTFVSPPLGGDIPAVVVAPVQVVSDPGVSIAGVQVGGGDPGDILPFTGTSLGTVHLVILGAASLVLGLVLKMLGKTRSSNAEHATLPDLSHLANK